MILKRAKTSEEKREIINRLYQAWLKAPELRLGQMIYNFIEEPELYYMEDISFVTRIEESINDLNKNQIEKFTTEYNKS